MKLLINYKIPIYKDNKIINFETKYIYEIEIENLNKSKKGGDIFDDINLDDIIIKKKDTEETKEITEELPSSENFGEINNLILKKHNIKFIKESKNKNLLGKYKINLLHFNLLNTIYDIKLLINYLLKIPIENQNLFNNDDSTIFYNYINNITKESIDINLHNVITNSTLSYHNNIPLDFSIINNRINYTITTYEKNKYLNKFNYNQDLEFDLYVLDNFILDKNNLNNEIEKDDELLNLIYKGFIEKYFPYYDINLFSLYLSNENKILEYPSLNFKADNIIKKNKQLYDIQTQLKKNKNIESKITTYYKKLTYYISSYNNLKILNIKELFNNIEIKKIPNIKKLELRLEIQNKFIYFNKQSIYSQNIKLNEVLLPNELTKDSKEILNSLYINNKNYNTLLGTPYLSNNILFISYSISSNEYLTDLYIIIDEYYNIFIIYNIGEYQKLNNVSDKNYLKYYQTNILESINKLFSNLFINKIIQTKKIIYDFNLELKFIDSQLILNQNISSNIFQKLYSIINNYLLVEYYDIFAYDELNNIIELNIKKIKYNDEDNKINTILQNYSNNYYNYYLKNDLIEKYNKILYTSKILITNRIKDIKIDIININKDEINDMTQLLLHLLSNITDVKKILVNESNSLKKNKLKKLKEIDPILYSINKKNTQNLYSRKCQASQQPDIITEIEAKKDKKSLKYINFTTGEPIYYTCNNKKFPNVKFLTNLHPQNYCIPCCKKKSIEDVKVKSKYTSVHNECLTTYKFDKKNKLVDEKSRYIMNYSSKIIIENLRLMQIPDSLFKLFNKIYEETTEIDLKYYILGVNQHINNIAYIGMFSILSFILNKNTNETINSIKDIFIKDSNIFNTILNGRLLNYFTSTKDFLIIFNNIYQDKILLNSLNFEFNQWNELFIDLLKYLGYICIIFEESIDDNINLIIPPNITHINQYIYNNQNFNYIIILKRIIQNKILYYPIIKTNYSEYYNKNKFYNKYFNYESRIIQLLNDIIKSKLPNINNSLNLDLIEQFILENNNYCIETYFINHKSEIYSILLSYKPNSKQNKKFVYLNINKQKVLNNSFYNLNKSELFQYHYIDIIKYNIQLNDIIIFIQDYNKYIYSKNKIYYSNIYYDSIKNTFNIDKLNDDINFIFTQDIIDKLHSYIYINNFIIYKNKIIGLQINCNNKLYNIYLSKDINESIGKQIIESKYKDIKKLLNKNKINKDDIKLILTLEFKSLKYSIINYLYNPHEINKIIYSKKYIIDDRIKKLNESLYHTNLYNLLLIHFSNRLSKIKNNILRAKIKHLINNLNKEDIKLIISNKFNKISDLINKNIQINNQEMKLTILYNLTSFIKNIIITNLSDNT